MIDSSRCKHDPPPREFNWQGRTSNPHAHNTLAAARDALLTAQRDFHEIILGAKNEVRALFGPDSDQVASQGLKKKSERSKPKRVFG